LDFGLLIAGLTVGLLVGLTGVGAGSVMTPVLIGIFGIPPHVAVGTDLAALSISKSFGAAVHGFAQRVKWRLVALLAAGGVPGVLVSLALLSHFGVANPVVTKIMRITVAVCVIATAISLFVRPWLMARYQRANPDSLKPTVWTAKRKAAAIFAGYVIGSFVAVSSIGAGAIGVVVMLLLDPRLTSAEVAGTDLAYAVPLTAVAALGHSALGTIDVTLLLALLAGTAPGIIVGSYVIKHVPERFLRGLLATALTAAAAKLVF
jgi:uncharacterized protein